MRLPSRVSDDLYLSMIQSGGSWAYSPYRRRGQHYGGNNFIKEFPVLAKSMARGAFNAVGKDLLKMGLSIGQQVMTGKSIKRATKDVLKNQGKNLAKKALAGAASAAKKKAGAGKISKSKSKTRKIKGGKKGGRKNKKLTKEGASTQRRLNPNQLLQP